MTIQQIKSLQKIIDTKDNTPDPYILISQLFSEEITTILKEENPDCDIFPLDGTYCDYTAHIYNRNTNNWAGFFIPTFNKNRWERNCKMYTCTDLEETGRSGPHRTFSLTQSRQAIIWMTALGEHEKYDDYD